MVDDMTRISFALFIVLHFMAATAAELPDPTRPPAFILGTDSELAPGQKPAERQPSGLQTTIISVSHRAAIIDGKTVELGAKHGNEVLIEVHEGSVVLRGAQTQRTLTLFPAVKMSRREVEIKKASPENGEGLNKSSTKSAAQYEKHLLGYPKEKK